ncbi:uncharacterized protein C8Q71DRAFT_846225 [Rhodofomes roseus]|uniref:Uncharacterized protein n=1 Tax=Rhodofomes roseus TaxID=34475 RepID=A0ABQ8KT23_9APHY|nr:uncharacterized protein C8Q71DRAFT_846225 [Rhodofomes roseus]KAH9840986.1 hypothetical protein C8Q71DRAFT_846225 [Rhodofomes roseus]
MLGERRVDLLTTGHPRPSPGSTSLRRDTLVQAQGRPPYDWTPSSQPRFDLLTTGHPRPSPGSTLRRRLPYDGTPSTHGFGHPQSGLLRGTDALSATRVLEVVLEGCPCLQSGVQGAMYEASSTMYEASSAMYEASSTMYEASSTMYEASSTMYEASSTMYEASSTMYEARGVMWRVARGRATMFRGSMYGVCGATFKACAARCMRPMPRCVRPQGSMSKAYVNDVWVLPAMYDASDAMCKSLPRCIRVRGSVLEAPEVMYEARSMGYGIH